MKVYRILTLFLIVTQFAGFNTQVLQAKENSLKKGKWALQFEIDSNFELRSFQGSTLSIKKHTADNRAYRLGLSFQFEISDGDLARPPYGPGNSPGDKDLIQQSYRLDLQKIYYADNSDAINLFFGLGPTVQYYYLNDKRDIRNDDDSYVNYEHNKNSAFYAGALGIIGVEWFVNKDISLLAEYGTSIRFETITRENLRQLIQTNTQYNQYNSENTQGISVEPTNVKFGLSVYF